MIPEVVEPTGDATDDGLPRLLLQPPRAELGVEDGDRAPELPPCRREQDDASM
jgi:hypothetical protein